MSLALPNVFFEKPQPSILSKVGWMGMDCHFHTEFSPDSIAGTDDTLRLAKKLGIGFAVTDHNAIGGSLKLFKNRYDVPIIPGIELTGKEGTHMLYYFYSPRDLKEAWDKEIKPYLKNPFFADKPTLELLRDISKYNCVISAPHPYAPGITGIKKLTKSENGLKSIHAVEVLNGYNLHTLNELAIKWMRQSKRSATGGTDGHMVEELGRVATFAPASDVEEFLDQIKKKSTVVIGEEDRALRKIVITLLKEHEMISKSREYRVARKLLQSQYHSSYNYYSSRFSPLKAKLSRIFASMHDHQETKVSKKKDEHPLGGSWTRSDQLG